MKVVKVHNLEMYNEPSLIFTANTPERKGLAVKSYTLTIPKTLKNNSELNNVWGAGVVRPTSYQAEYVIRGITLRGLLLVDSINDETLTARFVSGNGYLWSRMGQTQLRDIDMSTLNVVLSKSAVQATETGEPDLLFDLTDRGAFASPQAIDITDRFPALQIKKLFSLIANHFGVCITFDEWRTRLSNKYLLYMGDGKPRGSDAWLQEAIVHTELAFATNKRIGYGDEVNAVWVYKIPLLAKSNPGGYYDNVTQRYIVLQAGTYRFVAQFGQFDLSFDEIPPLTPPGISPSISYAGQANRVNTVIEIRRNGSPLARRAQIITLVGNSYTTTTPRTVDTFPVDLAVNDYIELYVIAEYSSVLSDDAVSNYAVTVRDSFMTATGSRWYGAGSTIVVNDLLPDISVLDFIRTVSGSLALDLYYDDKTNQLLIRSGRDVRPLITLNAMSHTIETGRPTNILIEHQTDKAAPPPNRYINMKGTDITVHKVNVSRTLVTRCYRLIQSGFFNIPVLWTTGDPMRYDHQLQPPAQQTSGAMRILQLNAPTDGAYIMTNGGNPYDYQATCTSVIQLVDIDTRELALPDLTLTADRWLAVVNIDESFLADLSLFKRPIMLRNQLKNIDIGLAFVIEAAQVRGSWYMLTLQPLVNYEVDPNDTLREVKDNTP